MGEEHDTQAHAVQTMACMEIWGGNRAIANGVSAPGLDAWVYAQPFRGDQSGGDVHYVSTCASGRISRFAIADVSGHGSGVDEFAQELRRLMRRHINTPDQSRFVRELNTEFGRLSRNGIFATALLATYFSPTDQLIIVNAGHPRPLLRRARSRTWEVLDGATSDDEVIRNLPLGIIDPTDYAQFAVTLERGDEVVIVTDALLESKGPDGGMLGEAGLIRVMNALPEVSLEHRVGALVDAIAAGALASGDGAFQDDVTVLWLSHNGGEPKRKSVGEGLAILGRLMGIGGPV